jgi:hypothetical protein
LPADHRGDGDDASGAHDFGNDGARIAKRFEIFQWVTVIVPPVAPFNLFCKRAERGGDSSSLMRGMPARGGGIVALLTKILT